MIYSFLLASQVNKASDASFNIDHLRYRKEWLLNRCFTKVMFIPRSHVIAPRGKVVDRDEYSRKRTKYTSR